jgi:hypothetical protein
VRWWAAMALLLIYDALGHGVPISDRRVGVQSEVSISHALGGIVGNGVSNEIGRVRNPRAEHVSCFAFAASSAAAMRLRVPWTARGTDGFGLAVGAPWLCAVLA